MPKLTYIEYSEKEKEIIKKSLELRIQNSKDENSHIEKLKVIFEKIDAPYRKLNSMEKAILTGCINESFIKPNQYIIDKSDFEILKDKEILIGQIEIIDCAFDILDKLKNKNDKRHLRLKPRIDRINKVLSSKKIYYSLSQDGELSKIGFITESNKGFSSGTLNGSSPLNKIDISSLYKDSFKSSGQPKELYEYLKTYETTNKLTEQQKNIKLILEKASV